MKPFVICHMMSPLDGQLVVRQWSASTGRSADALDAESNRIHAELKPDAWLCGRSTGEEFATAEPHPPETFPDVVRPIHVAKTDVAFAVFLDRDGKLHWPGPKVTDDAVIVVVGEDIADAHLAELMADGISYIVSPDGIDLNFVLETLNTQFGVKRLLLEGGAQTNTAFLKAGLVDEISLVLFPAIGGLKGGPTIFGEDADGLADKVRLEMLSTELRRGAVHLRYSVEHPQ
jgi:riboflavin biosynthesis pyrimidine reductase